MATIYLVRHGQASFGSDNYDCLSELGREQAIMTGRYFQRCGIELDASYSGDLQRQRDTASLVCEQQRKTVPHSIDVRFNEIDNEQQMEILLPSLLKNKPELEALLHNVRSNSKNYQKILQQVFNAWVNNEHPNGNLQSWENYQRDARDALLAVMKAEGAGKRVAIFTSGGTIATLVSVVLGLTGQQIYAFYEPVVNCSITALFYSGERVSLSGFNDYSFLNMLGDEYSRELVSYR